MAIIEVNHVTKEFQLGHLKTIKQTFMNGFDRLRGRQIEKAQPFKALDDVSFSVEPGEVLGIIGTNGAGKSTLLKLLARISKPTRGKITVNGAVAPLIEVGAGLVGDLTGRENIFLNGAILGLSQADIRKKFDEIVAFAELEQFIDTPIKRYSSGMAVRLGFAIATSVDADILIVDEVLAVGDLAFQRKCFDRMEELIKRQERTVLLVSHNIRQVERICTRTILLDHGGILADASPREVCDLFYARSDEKIKLNAEAISASALRHESTGEVELLEVILLNEDGVQVEEVIYLGSVTIAATFKINKELTLPIFGFGIHTTDFLYLATEICETEFDSKALAPGIYRLEYNIMQFPLLPGVYSIRIGVNAGELSNNVFYSEGVCHFQVISPFAGRTRGMHEGFLRLQGTWKLCDEERINTLTGQSRG